MNFSMFSHFLIFMNRFNNNAKGKTIEISKLPQKSLQIVPSTMAETWATLRSSIDTLKFAWTIVCQYSPYGVLHLIDEFRQRLKDYFNPYIEISIHEYRGNHLLRNKAYSFVEAYLCSKTSYSANRLKAKVETGGDNLVLRMDDYERVTDQFHGIKVWWDLRKLPPPKYTCVEQEKRFYRLTFHKRNKEIVTKSYLEHVMRKGKEIRTSIRQRKLYTNRAGFNKSSSSIWSHIPFEHKASFETMALDYEKKQEIVEDLLAFSKNKEFYERVGKAWKRGYLLYGPPGTGKSTMIAAMANLLSYDVYDLELTAVKDNTELRRLLIETTSKSIIVIEDIDCSLDLTGQRKKKKAEKSCLKRKEQEVEENRGEVTLSGLLNVIDGIWSACGAERLIVFTTNHVKKLDPALIRRGRMDKHIELSYCSFGGFKVLAKNYLNLENHQMFDRIESLIGESKITPADVAENLMPKSPHDEPERYLSNLIQALESTKKAAAKKKAKKSK